MKQLHQYQLGNYMSKGDFEEIREIFQTPLIGSYNWDYTAADDRINRLYQLAKKRQWNVEIDIDWTEPWNMQDANIDDYVFFHEQLLDYAPYAQLSDDDKLDFQKKIDSWNMAQFLHGEQGALLVASQLCSCAPTYNAKLYAATQAYDEARHVEAFNKYIQTRQRTIYPITTELKDLLDKILTDERWDLKFIGMQIIIEGLALGAFKTVVETHPDPLLRKMIDYIIKDESRHVTFGVNYLEDYVKNLSQEEIEERAQFAYEACVIMRNRLFATVVYEEFGWDVEETINYVRNVEFREQFQTFLFQRVIPNLKRVGMLTDNIRPKFEKMGVMQFEHSPDDKDLDWSTI